MSLLPTSVVQPKLAMRAGRILEALGVDPNQPAEVYQPLCAAAGKLGDDQFKEDLRQLKLLAHHGAPQSKLIEYLLAPSFPNTMGSATREEIAAKFYENVAPDYAATDRAVRALSIVMAVSAVVGFGAGAGTYLAGGLSTNPFTAVAMEEGGRAVMQLFHQALDVGILGAGGWLASNKFVGLRMDMKKARRDAAAPTGLNKVLADDNGPEALRGQYGFKANQASLIDQLSRISHPERHLLKHFAPHDLRVFLLSGDDERVRMFQTQPPPAANQRLWRLAVRQESGEAKFLDLAAIRDELEVMLSRWSAPPSKLKSPVAMEHAIARMRERHANPTTALPAHNTILAQTVRKPGV